MKKVFLTTIIAIMLASISFAGPVITIKLTIGKRSQPTVCPNFGFCHFSIVGISGDDLIAGTLDVNTNKGSMIIGINENDILKYQPDKIIYFKGKKNVVFEEDFVFPEEFNSVIKTTKPIILKKGEYPLSYNNGMYYIEIPL